VSIIAFREAFTKEKQIFMLISLGVIILLYI